MSDSKATVIKPTVGRVLWFSPGNAPECVNWTCLDPEQPMRADVVFVHDDHTVNLVVNDHLGAAWVMEQVPLVQEGEKPPAGRHCAWMPYQVGQAKK